MLKPTLSILTALLLAPLAVLTAAEPPLVLILSWCSSFPVSRTWQAMARQPTSPTNVTLIHCGRTQALGTGSIGPEVTLARALARAMPGSQIVLFKAAHGGTSQLAWQPELDQARIDRLKLSHDQRVGHAYAQLIAAWKKAFPAGDIKPAALLWMQGESDARVPELAKDYE